MKPLQGLKNLTLLHSLLFTHISFIYYIPIFAENHILHNEWNFDLDILKFAKTNELKNMIISVYMVCNGDVSRYSRYSIIVTDSICWKFIHFGMVKKKRMSSKLSAALGSKYCDIFMILWDSVFIKLLTKILFFTKNWSERLQFTTGRGYWSASSSEPWSY